MCAMFLFSVCMLHLSKCCDQAKSPWPEYIERTFILTVSYSTNSNAFSPTLRRRDEIAATINTNLRMNSLKIAIIVAVA